MEVVEAIDVNPIENREKFFEELYKAAFPKTAAFVRKMNGSLQDARDIFQDALVIFYEKIREEKTSFDVSAEAYLLGISKHLWIRKFKKDFGKVAFDELEKEVSIPEDFFPEEENFQLLQLIESSGRKCLELLTSFYYNKLSMKSLAQAFGYASERSATVQKYKCIEKLRNRIKDNNLRYEDFTY